MAERREGKWEPAPGLKVKWDVRTSVRVVPAGTRVGPRPAATLSLAAADPAAGRDVMRLPLLFGGVLLLLGLAAVAGGSGLAGWTFALLGALVLVGAGYTSAKGAPPSRPASRVRTVPPRTGSTPGSST